MFDDIYIIRELEKNKSIFQYLFSGQEKEKYLWRPQANKWNLLEVVCHLYDEEIYDFRARVNYALLEKKEIPPIDPEAWVKEKKYASKDYQKTIEAFLLEREKSITWLYSLKKVEWKKCLLHPTMGEISAQYFLTNWLAHDYLHIKQILKIQHQYLEYKTRENLKYAGNW